jgi:hypothetical protein
MGLILPPKSIDRTLICLLMSNDWRSNSRFRTFATSSRSCTRAAARWLEAKLEAVDWVMVPVHAHAHTMQVKNSQLCSPHDNFRLWAKKGVTER